MAMENVELKYVKKELQQYKIGFYFITLVAAGLVFLYFQTNKAHEERLENLKILKPMIIDAWECKGKDGKEIEEILDNLFD